jgi:hypothetical protein
MPKFRVIYWAGGAERGEWLQADPAATREEGEARAVSIRRAGRAALCLGPGEVSPEKLLGVAPRWWDFVALRPKAPIPG